MSDVGKAVFLSYASQDAEAAKRICDALRAAGVEVWFDQSELVGGDAWDAKIKKQIRECTLFVPLITPATNARAEGYFRREWKQAVERTHDMADDVPFLFPIVIGDITDATARVPDKFREVQWTRLKLEETAGELAARIARLLSGNGGPVSDRPHSRGGESFKKHPGRWQWWMIFPIFGMTMGMILALKERGPGRSAPPEPPAKPAAPAISEARQLVARAAEITDKGDLTRAQLEAAEELCTRARQLDSTDAEVWIEAARVDLNFVHPYRYDRSDERRKRALSYAAKAVNLAPDSYRARAIQAAAFAHAGESPALREEAEKILRGLLRERPDDPPLLLQLAEVLRAEERMDEAAALFERAGEPEIAGWSYYMAGKYQAAYEAVNRALAQKRSVSRLTLKTLIEIDGHEDLDAAQATLDQLNPSELLGDIAANAAAMLALKRRDPDRVLQIMNALPEAYLSSAGYRGPKEYYTGWARSLAGHSELARIEWQAGLAQVQERLKAEPRNQELVLWIARLKALSGEKAETERALQNYQMLAGLRPDQVTSENAEVFVLLGRREEFLAWLLEFTPALKQGSGLRHADLRFLPVFDPLRGDPRFEKLLRDTLPKGAKPFDGPKSVTLSPARHLVAKAYSLFQELDATREDFALAEEYCQRALKLDPDDGEVWAIYSQVHSAFGYRGWDTSPERREQTRTTAERAMRLAPQSVNARLAQAGAWATFGINREEREKFLREIVRDDPDNKEALRFLAVTVLPKPGGLEEALALNERAAALPGGDPLALFNNARYLWTSGQPAKGYEVLQRSLAQRKFTSALVLKMGMELTWRGDLAAAEETLKQIPPSALQEDRANYSAGLLRYYQGDAAGALEIWGAFPRDFYLDFIFDGPKGLLLGLADELDHRDVAARTEWRAALREVEKRIAATPNRASPYYSQAYLLACLGEKAAAGEALRTHEQLAQIKYTPGQGMTIPLAKVYARLGRFDEIFAHLPGTPAVLRISPDFDALRADPRFQQLLATAAIPAKSQSQDPKPSGPPPADAKSVAVLAFANLSDDKANEYFSDGISEELLNVLAKIPDLKVAARTSAFYFKGKEVPIPEIARQLGVAYVVEGSVRKQGNRVRITAQLIKADGGFHVWSDTFTRDLKDIFAVQDEIAGLIARNISPMLNTAQVAQVREIAPDAYQEYLLGRAAVAKAVMADLRESLAHFERAVVIEPKFTAAWVQLANAHTRLGRWGGAPAIPSWQAARAAIDRAMALEPDSPEVLVALGWILRTGEWKWREAERAFRRALELRPNQPDVLAGAAVLLYNIGQTEEAMRLGQRAAQLDPLNASTQIDLSIMFYLHGDLPQAETAARRALQLAPDGASYHAILSWSLIDQKRFAEAEIEIALDPDPVEQPTAYARLALARGDEATARKMIAQLEELARTNPDAADLQQSIAWICAGLGEKENDRSFAALERAKASRDPSMAWLLSSRYLLPLQSDPRWEKLKRSMGLAEDQLR